MPALNFSFFIYLAVLWLHCWRGCFLLVVQGLVLSQSITAGLQQLWHMSSAVAAPGFQSTGSVVVEHRPSCSSACGILLHQGSNLSFLHWQTDSLPLSHQGNPQVLFKWNRTICTGLWLTAFVQHYEIIHIAFDCSLFIASTAFIVWMY